MNHFMQDLRYSARMLLKNRGFTTVAVLTLALGIGANTATFSTVNALLLHPFPFPYLDRLVLPSEVRDTQGEDTNRFAPADYIDLTRQTHSLDGVAAYRYANLVFTEGETEGVEGAAVSSNLFQLLGVNAASGRTFSPDEDQQGRDQVIVLNHRYWVRRFGGDPNVIGRAVQVNGQARVVIGILPEKFNFPVGMDVWVPLVLRPEEQIERNQLSLHVVARLASGTSVAQARSELQAFAARLSQEFPATNSNRNISLMRLREMQYQYTAPMFLTVQAAAIFVLLLTCANLVNLLFAKLIGRQRELAIRTALGAKWNRLAQTLLSETVLLSLIAGALAVATSFWSINLIRASLPPGMTKWIAGWSDIRVDGHVLTFALLLTVLVGCIFGALSAFRATHLDLNNTLKEGSRALSSGRGRDRLRSSLIIGQIMLALVLLVGAGLMIKGFSHLVTVYQGLQPSRVLSFEIGLPEKTYPNAKVEKFYEELLRRTAALPGLRSLGIASNVPASNVENLQTMFSIEGQPALKESEAPTADLESASGGFFDTLRIPVLQGRPLADQDGVESPRVGVISQSMARRFWPGHDALGRRLKLGKSGSKEPLITIVGIVDDVKQNWWDPKPRPTIYLPYQQAPHRTMNVVVRTAADPNSIVSEMRSVVQSIDTTVPLKDVQPMESLIDDALSPVRMIGILLMVFGAVALSLSALGVYGVLAESVAQRTQEFGIRQALGARTVDVLKLVVGQALRFAGFGLVLGLPISILLTRVMSSFLFGVVSLNLGILAGLAALLLVVAVTAGYVPARRAMKVDPLVALRYE